MSLSNLTTTGIRMLPAATVTVFVREVGRMRSRRLIDVTRMPCTFGMYTALMKQDIAPVKEEHSNLKLDVQVAGRATKRIRR